MVPSIASIHIAVVVVISFTNFAESFPVDVGASKTGIFRRPLESRRFHYPHRERRSQGTLSFTEYCDSAFSDISLPSKSSCRVKVNPRLLDRVKTDSAGPEINLKPHHGMRVSSKISTFFDLLGMLHDGLTYLNQSEFALLQRALAINIRIHTNAAGTREGRRRAELSVNLCLILGKLEMDIDILLAALLLGTSNPELGPLQQTPSKGASYKDLRRRFGSNVVRLIESFEHVTHLESLAQYHMAQRSLEVKGLVSASESAAQLEQLCNLILSEIADWRVVALRVTVHLQQMRSCSVDPRLNAVSSSLAQEALGLHAPLAHRLGIHQLVAELQDLAFRSKYPRQNARIRKEMAAHREVYEAVLNRATIDLTAALESNIEFMSQMESVTLVGRTKEPYSMWRKCLKQGRTVSDVYDAVALRVVFKARRFPYETDLEYDNRSAALCYDAMSIVQDSYPTVLSRFKDYVKSPKQNGYRSLHATALMQCSTDPEGIHPFEVQVRSSAMHQQAEYGVAAHWGYKGEGSTNWLASSPDSTDLECVPTTDFANGCEFVDWLHNKLQSQKVFVFGPDGLIWDLEKNAATAADIVRRMSMDNFYSQVYGRQSSLEIMVQGMQVPYDYVLQNGDAISVMS